VQSDLGANLSAVLERVKNAASRAGRDSDEIKLVAVSKTHPPDVIRQAIELGVTTFGENKVQEAEAKIGEVRGSNVEWHLIGHLQSNKARKAVQLFDVIQSLDSMDLAARLERMCIEENRSTLPVFVQVDLAGEETKSGISREKLPALIDYLKVCRKLSLKGLMVLPPFFDDPEDARPFFQELRTVRDDLLSQWAFAGGRGELSMGMSHDFEIAIEEGATVIRVGTAIFGAR
jgi:pyridoxal phosphate enzyme (YggS family)